MSYLIYRNQPLPPIGFANHLVFDEEKMIPLTTSISFSSYTLTPDGIISKSRMFRLPISHYYPNLFRENVIIRLTNMSDIFVVDSPNNFAIKPLINTVNNSNYQISRITPLKILSSATSLMCGSKILTGFVHTFADARIVYDRKKVVAICKTSYLWFYNSIGTSSDISEQFRILVDHHYPVRVKN